MGDIAIELLGNGGKEESKMVLVLENKDLKGV